MVKQQTYKLYYRQISENFWFESKILHYLGLNHIINMVQFLDTPISNLNSILLSNSTTKHICSTIHTIYWPIVQWQDISFGADYVGSSPIAAHYIWGRQLTGS